MNKLSKYAILGLACLAGSPSCGHYGWVFYGPQEENTLEFLAMDKEYQTSVSGETRPVTVNELRTCPTGTDKVTGTSGGGWFGGAVTLFLGVGSTPSAHEAYRNALAKAPGAIALKDVSICKLRTDHFYLLPLLHAIETHDLVISGTPVYAKEQ